MKKAVTFYLVAAVFILLALGILVNAGAKHVVEKFKEAEARTAQSLED